MKRIMTRIENAVDALDMVSEYLRNAPGADINRGNMEALIRNIRGILTQERKSQAADRGQVACSATPEPASPSHSGRPERS